MDWLPTITEWQGPIYLRIVDALSADINSRRLNRGQQLPTHRALAEARIFPAINIKASGTRKEELLYTPAEMEKLHLLRRALADRDGKRSMTGLLKLLEKAATNDELLRRLKRKG